jgi:hypothetical protein
MVRVEFASNVLLLPLHAREFVAQVLAESHQQRILILQVLQNIVSALICRVAEANLPETFADCLYLLLVLLRLRLVGSLRWWRLGIPRL